MSWYLAIMVYTCASPKSAQSFFCVITHDGSETRAGNNLACVRINAKIIQNETPKVKSFSFKGLAFNARKTGLKILGNQGYSWKKNTILE